jgi:hypothetical protein
VSYISQQARNDSATYLFFRFLKGISYGSVLPSSIIKAEFGDKSIEFIVPRSSKFEDVKKILIEKEFINDSDNSVHACLLTELGLQPLEDATTLPNDARICLKQTEALKPIWAIAAVVADGYLAVAGEPFLVPRSEQLTLADVKPQIAAILGLSDEQIGKTKFFNGATDVSFNIGSALPDSYDLTNFPATQALFVVADPPKNAAVSKREEAVKIGV